MRFNGDAYFNGTHFRGVANFTGATFAQHASFFGAEFYDDTFFASGVRFEKGSRFVKTKFHRGVSFDDVWFAESAVFDGCAIRPPQPSYTALGTILGNFMRADLHNVVFRSCTLSDAELSGAYAIDQAEYENITWGEIRVRHPITGHSKTVREVISEERSARETDDPQDLGSAERIYRNLRRSYEGHRRFILAAAFWARELEMRRMSRLAGQTGWRRTLANYETPEAWYAALSGYGQATLRPLFILFGVLLVFPAIFALIGIRLNDGDWYRPDWSWEGVLGYMALLAFTVRTASLLNDPPGTQLAPLAQLAQVVLRLVAPFLALLFTLAVRRRFRT
jgi:hypothetical protein